jgi:hypothetical protein
MLRPFGFAGVLALVLTSGSVHAFDVTRDDRGGAVENYVARLKRAEARGEPIRIGAVECDSSCTLYLAASRACVSPQAVLGFHAPWAGSPRGGPVDPWMTAMFARSYRPELRAAFLSHVRRTGPVGPGPLMRISGAQLAQFGYRLCGEGETREASVSRRRPFWRRVNPRATAESPPSFFPW